MSTNKPKGRVQEFDPEYVRDLAEAVYRDMLGPDDVRRMIEKDKDSGERLRRRAAFYDPMCRSFLRNLPKVEERRNA